MLYDERTKTQLKSSKKQETQLRLRRKKKESFKLCAKK